jgi:molecular chaperone DnaJ
MPNRHEHTTKDHYHTLGVPPAATTKDITKAYRKLAREHHPDINPGDTDAENRFKEISAAYDILSDETKRRRYNTTRPAAKQTQPATAASNDNSFTNSYIKTYINNLFREALGNTNTANRKNDIYTTVLIDFATAVNGGHVTATIYPDTPCDDCDNCGKTPATTSSTCPRCPETSRFPQPKTITVNLPAGASIGDMFKVDGVGHRRQHETGDLYLTVDIHPDPMFTRRGNDLETTVTIDYPCAVRGGTVAVPTVNSDPVHIKIQAGTKSGTRIKLRGKGIQTPGHPGDLIVTVDINIPNHITTQLDAALDTLEQALDHINDRNSEHTDRTGYRNRRTKRSRR